MRFQPGQSGNPAGRPPGPNKITADVRAVIRTFAESYADKLPTWIDRVAEEDPARAVELFLRACEYVLPKLGRHEVTGLDGRPLGPVVPVVEVVISGPAPRIIDGEAGAVTGDAGGQPWGQLLDALRP